LGGIELNNITAWLLLYIDKGVYSWYLSKIMRESCPEPRVEWLKLIDEYSFNLLSPSGRGKR
jgi:hypothetical protein